MQREVRRSLFAPLHYWRTITLVLVVGLAMSLIFRDALVVLFTTLASAFVFSGYERRHWIVMPTQLQAGDCIVRLSLAIGATYVLVSRL